MERKENKRSVITSSPTTLSIRYFIQQQTCRDWIAFMHCHKITKLPALINNISIKEILLFLYCTKSQRAGFKRYQENRKLLKTQIQFRNVCKQN